MNLPSLRPSRPFIFSLLVASIIAAKLLHLVQHAASVPTLEFILYFPTFFISDVFVAIFGRFLLHAGGGGVWQAVGLLSGTFLSLMTFFASASQLGFYYVTGAEMQWDKASNIATDATAIKLMLSGIVQVSVSGLIIFFFAWLMTPGLYNKMAYWMWAGWKILSPSKWEMILPTVRARSDRSDRSLRIWPFVILLSVSTVTVLWVIRPSTPYNHMATTLPVAMLQMLHVDGKPHCRLTGAPPPMEPFPLPDLIAEEHWKMPKDNFKGWAPGDKNFMTKRYEHRRPKWLLDNLPYGFGRWANAQQTFSTNATAAIPDTRLSDDVCTNEISFYNPVADPLRITNLDLDIYETLKAAFNNETVLVSHIVLVTMESGRKGLFPLREDSFLHQAILESHNAEDYEAANQKFAEMTPVAQQVTGEPFWKDPEKQAAFQIPNGTWKDFVEPGMGGINVIGAISGSSLSFKSVLNSHCGVFPLPVDFLEETTTDIYQPCLPQLLNLFNKAKDLRNPYGKPSETAKSRRSEVQGRRWKSVNVQSATDSYDRQGVMNKQMGFSKLITKETLVNQSSKNFPPKSEELNYFGYPDHEVKPYIRDEIEDAIKNNQRLFLSHFTGATHHPWKIPPTFGHVNYVGSKGKHKNMNKYMNTIHYDDHWLGQILDVLDETGIANETLVVFIGDHGQAFEEDFKVQGTYNNGHISNFRVPIVLRHPHLPRINVEANATSMTFLPTLLDLLVNSKSLDEYDSSVAADLIHDYEGQSLLRPFKSSSDGRQSWNVGIINAGGRMLAVTSAASQFRVIVPLIKETPYIFADLETDPNERDTLTEWSIKGLLSAVRRKHGEPAERWLKEADDVTRWWVKEMHRRWNYPEKK
ncbi:hypothetical protein FQN57_005713 [Myotisia sp. PD_48]|nr:hypothetical protein FQN57_005713 [Myotisia sp. PD_48]